MITRCLAAALVVAVAATAGEPPATRPAASRPAGESDLRRELEALRRRLEALEARHAAQHEADRKRIAELEREVQELRDRALATQRARSYAELSQELSQQMQSQPPSQAGFGLSQGGEPGAGALYSNLYNPATTVFFDLGASASDRGENKAINRFNFREAELDFRAAVAPFADGVLILALGEEIEQQRSGDVDIRRDVDIEEGYLDFHTLPWDLSLKIGKFRNAFGRNNVLHTHDLPQVTRPAAVRAFLGPEGIGTVGASFSWLVPNPWDEYLELRAEVVDADAGPEAPLLGGASADNPAVVAHLSWFHDLDATTSLEIGGSYMYAKTDPDADFDGHTFGTDITFMWVDPDPSRFRSIVIQTEAFWARNDVNRGLLRSFTNDSFGFYTFFQYQINRDWYAGIRFDYTEFPNSEVRGPDDYDIAFVPYVSWYMTEFLRVRTQVEHRIFREHGDHSSETAVFVQFTFVIGAHPPHPYWVHR